MGVNNFGGSTNLWVNIFWPPPPRHVRRKISAGVDGGLNGGSSVRRPRSEDPHRRQRKFYVCCQAQILSVLNWCSGQKLVKALFKCQEIPEIISIQKILTFTVIENQPGFIIELYIGVSTVVSSWIRVFHSYFYLFSCLQSDEYQDWSSVFCNW